jgi:aspartate dehydrogenase
VPHFPANVNIAAALALAGIGFDRKRLTVAADPALKFNTHFARIRGASGPLDLPFENCRRPTIRRPRCWAGFSALAAHKQFNSPVRYGT